jgi:hypothetical protein
LSPNDSFLSQYAIIAAHRHADRCRVKVHRSPLTEKRGRREARSEERVGSREGRGDNFRSLTLAVSLPPHPPTLPLSLSLSLSLSLALNAGRRGGCRLFLSSSLNARPTRRFEKSAQSAIAWRDLICCRHADMQLSLIVTIDVALLIETSVVSTLFRLFVELDNLSRYLLIVYLIAITANSRRRCEMII